MKIGLISDIHADAEAFQKALDGMTNQHGVHKILCAGDLVERGTQGDQVVEMIQHHKIPSVKGNHDDAAWFNQRWLQDNLDPTSPNYSHRILTSNTLAYLEALPLYLSFEFEGVSILLGHGSPRSNLEYVTTFSDKTRLDLVLEGVTAKTIILGHTHIPMEITYRGRQILNPGSVSRDAGRGGSYSYGILELPSRNFTVYHIEDHAPLKFEQVLIP